MLNLFKQSQCHNRVLLLATGLVAIAVVGYVVFLPSRPRQQTSLSKHNYPALPVPAHPTTPPKVAGPTLGIAAGGSLGNLSNTVLESELDAIAASGAKWIRFDIDWSNVQPKNVASYDWKNYDRLVDGATQRRLQVLAILDYTPEWARPASCKDSAKCPPAHATEFARFAKAATIHYSPKGVHTWEIWNEPNNPQFWTPKVDPDAYANLLAESYVAIHTADTTATVITGGLSPQSTSAVSRSPYDFLQQIYGAGARHYFDAVADHPYTFPLTPASSDNHAWRQMAADSSSLRTLMTDNGDAEKKIWITEFGAPTGGPGAVATLTSHNLDQHPFVVDEALQAKNLSDALALYSSYTWAGPLMYYSFRDAGTTNDTNENFFGLIRHDGSHKLVYDIFKATSR